MIKTMLTSVLVGTCMLCAYTAGAATTPAASLVGSEQDFESYTHGDKDIHRQTEPAANSYFWSSPSEESLVTSQIVYDNADDNQYLDISASERPAQGLMRLFVPHSSSSGVVTGALTSVVSGDSYNGFYCSFRTKLPLYEEGLSPELDEEDRLVIWARTNAVNSALAGQMYVTAGCYVDAFRSVVQRQFPIVTTNIDSTAWHEITIRAVPELLAGSRALGFLLWIDGLPVEADADGYQIYDGSCQRSQFTLEARAMLNARRLFPSLTAPGVNASVALNGVAFTGLGSVDDIVVSTNAPAYAAAPRIFTLNWDVGVTGVTYRVAGGEPVELPQDEIAFRTLSLEVPSVETEVEVSALYNTAGDYRQGFWTAAGACEVVTNVSGSVTNYAFRCLASKSAASGYVRSFRREISLGGGGAGVYGSFAEAKAQSKAQGGATIVLNEDFAARSDTDDWEGLKVLANESVTIDLNGHSITNALGENPTIVNYGKLKIIDSSVGDKGHVVPYVAFTGNTNDDQQIAIQNYASKHYTPELTIMGGIYDGRINNCGDVTNAAYSLRAAGKLSIDRAGPAHSDPQFISLGGDEFEYSEHLVDPTLYYAYEEPYWKPFTNAFIWCGRGADDKWSTAANWRCNAVPAAGDYAIFPPAGTNVWEADMETGIAVRDVWFAGDVELHGSADFSEVKWTTPSDGRVRGDATLTWNGKLPPNLSTLLDSRWAGVVKVVEVGHKSPKLMGDMGSWGTANSTVVFAGVRGYYHSTVNLTASYTLELVNGANGYGWKNDAGFTGGVITIPKLTGSGDFVSPKNTIANRQIIVFRDVMSYYGDLDVLGKRVVLGPGNAETLEAGSITWSTGLAIRSGHIHNCRVAAFGGTMDVTGSYDDELATYTDSTVGDTAMVVNLMPGSITAELCVTNPVGVVKVVRWSDDAVIIDGRRVVTNQLLTANSLTSITAPTTQSRAALQAMSFQSYYTPTVTTSGSMFAIRLALNQNAVPVIGGTGGESAKINFTEDGMVSIVVSGVIEGFWYGLQYKESLADEWTDPYVWTVAQPDTGNQAELYAPECGESGFYRVVVSDVDPNEATD